MTTDPRTTDQGRHTARARWWAEEFDRADAAAGVVRVDTRNPATLTRWAQIIQYAFVESLSKDGTVMDRAFLGERAAARLLAALANGGAADVLTERDEIRRSHEQAAIIAATLRRVRAAYDDYLEASQRGLAPSGATFAAWIRTALDAPGDEAARAVLAALTEEQK